MFENDYTKYLTPIGQAGLFCAGCGRYLKATDLVVDCPDCGAIYCESCVRDGTFENHSCEDEEDDEW